MAIDIKSGVTANKLFPLNSKQRKAVVANLISQINQVTDLHRDADNVFTSTCKNYRIDCKWMQPTQAVGAQYKVDIQTNGKNSATVAVIYIGVNPNLNLQEVKKALEESLSNQLIYVVT